MSAIRIAGTALKAFDQKLNVSANNIANMDTDEFKKSSVVMKEGTHQGVIAETQKINTPGILDVDPTTGVETELSNVDMLEEIVNQLSAKYAYEANMMTIQTAKEMQNTLLDILS